MEIEGFSTALLNLGLENKKVILIGNNRYEWCVSYLAVTTGNMVIVPLDKALPDGEIKNLIETSKADAVIYENKYADIFNKLKESKSTTIKNFINMDLEKEEKGIFSFRQLVEQGIKLIENGNEEYNKIKLDDDKMSILLFTSGTTSQPKGVMLSQKNICSNVMGMAKMSKMYSDDVSTFIFTITPYFRMYNNIFILDFIVGLPLHFVMV